MKVASVTVSAIAHGLCRDFQVLITQTAAAMRHRSAADLTPSGSPGPQLRPMRAAWD
jgi:hypothetical protein